MLKGFTGIKEGSTMFSHLAHADFKLRATAFLAAVSSAKSCCNFVFGGLVGGHTEGFKIVLCQ